MCSNKKNLISLDKVHIPRWNELPNVDLYLDQVVTFINSSLEAFLPCNGGNDDKKENQILTKTMINNYVRNIISQICIIVYNYLFVLLC